MSCEGPVVAGLVSSPLFEAPAGAAPRSPGLSSLHISPRSGIGLRLPEGLPPGDFYVGPHNEPEGNKALWEINDELEGFSLSAAAEHWDFGWRALPASVFFAGKREREVHRVEWADGGNYVRYRGGRGVAPANVGNRGVVTEFSAKSRFKLLTFLSSVDRSKVNSLRVWFLTLTYPFAWPSEWQTWKDHLDAFIKRLERSWGRCGVVWKIEPQRRGAPHFHLMVLVPPAMVVGLKSVGEKEYNDRRVTIWSGGDLGEFRQWCSQAWFEVVGSGDVKHLAAGTAVEPMQAWEQLISYAGKYIGKQCVFLDDKTGEVLQAGRFWGVRRRELWPVRIVTHTLGQEEWVVMRRILRRYQESVQRRDLRGRGGQPPSFAWVGYVRPCAAFIPAQVVQKAFELVAWWVKTDFRNYSSVWEMRRVVRPLVN